MKLRFLYSAAILVALAFQVDAQEGELDFLDPCKKQEAKFANTRDAVKERQDSASTRLAGWRSDPSTLPAEIEEQYRAAVRAYIFSVWSNSPTGTGVLASWGEISGEEAYTKFFDNIYPTLITDDDERKTAHALFQRDYDERIRPDFDKEIAEQNVRLEEAGEKVGEACSPDVFSTIVRSTIGRAVMIVGNNFEAAKDEKGDLAAVVRAVSGISVTDILKYGIAGGENSEFNKIKETWSATLDFAGIGENHAVRVLLRELDVTNVDLPDEVEVTVDDESAENLTTNLTGGLIKDGKLQIPKVEVPDIPTPKLPDIQTPKLPKIKW
ncbi:hypothetical protein [uncultured Roseobacter sp.]|uniref:hypothetical protein n=1 Tax=uncultured Roseobacter sp. TaxID=114847 RepID=UPI002602DA3A|nr:hypothetical protein [uncultured Roseobacter sp.]